MPPKLEQPKPPPQRKTLNPLLLSQEKINAVVEALQKEELNSETAIPAAPTPIQPLLPTPINN